MTAGALSAPSAATTAICAEQRPTPPAQDAAVQRGGCRSVGAARRERHCKRGRAGAWRGARRSGAVGGKRAVLRAAVGGAARGGGRGSARRGRAGGSGGALSGRCRCDEDWRQVGAVTQRRGRRAGAGGAERTKRPRAPGHVRRAAAGGSSAPSSRRRSGAGSNLAFRCGARGAVPLRLSRCAAPGGGA